MSMQEKNARPGFNNSGVKGGQTPTANRRTQPIISSTKKSGSSICTSIKMKENYAKPKISGRKLFCPSNNSLKEENATDVASTVVTETKSATEVQPLVGMEIRAALLNEDYALSNMEPENSCTDMGLTCSSITGIASPLLFGCQVHYENGKYDHIIT
ncbi:hypothetical protein OsI_15568 [Oryza sativa Indica Group]|uniref:Uncharacterized protein n=1 Tax=Oryza sativa subsp. indica TaxID=39946 RepID=B8AT00_ORYSI|nr:hypothetical protein OsI_15568 [Oryza sativa Indica Group]